MKKYITIIITLFTIANCIASEENYCYQKRRQIEGYEYQCQFAIMSAGTNEKFKDFIVSACLIDYITDLKCKKKSNTKYVWDDIQ
jgi:hypothetical protein